MKPMVMRAELWIDGHWIHSVHNIHLGRSITQRDLSQA